MVEVVSSKEAVVQGKPHGNFDVEGCGFPKTCCNNVKWRVRKKMSVMC